LAQLDDLENALRDAIAGERLRLTEQLAQALNFPDPPAWLGSLSNLEIVAPVISRPAGLLVVSGSLDDALLGAAVFTCEVAVSDDELSPRLRWMTSVPPRLVDFLERAGLSFAAAAGAFIDSVVVRGLRLQTLADGAVAITVEVSGVYAAKLANLEFSIGFSSVAFAAGGARVAQVRGTATLGGLALPLSVTLDDPVRVSAILPSLTLMDLARDLGLEVPQLPPLPLLATQLETLGFVFAPDLRLSGRVPIGGLGALVFVAAEVDGSIVLAAGLEVAAGFRFGGLVPALAPLDQLMSVLRLGTPALILSTADVRQLPYPTGDGGWRSLAVPAGASFQGELAFQGLGLDAVGALLNLSALPFRIPLAANLADLKVLASLPLRLEAIPGVLTVEGVEIAMTAQPFSLSAAGRAELVVFGERLPALDLGVGVNGAQQGLFLRTAEPWKQPLGFPIEIVELGLEISTPPPAYGFFGKIRLLSRELSVAAKFFGQAPTMVAAEAHGDLALSNLLAELIQVDLLPDFFEPSLKDPTVYIVLNPLGEMIAGRLYPSGLAISGAMEYLGLTAELRLSAKLDRVVAEAGLSAPVRFPPILELTGPGGVGTPSFAIDTGADPIVTFGARVVMMGLIQDVRGVAGTAGVSIELAQSVGPVDVSLSGLLSNGKFAANGRLRFLLQASVGPIQLFAGGPNLGEIRLDSGLEMLTDLQADAQGAKVSVRGSFVVAGMTISLPEIAISSDAFARIPEEIVAYIRDHAIELFAELFSSADIWLRAIAEGVVRGVENVARALKDHFERQAEAIARGLTDALSYTTEQVGAALKSIGESAENIAKALTAIGRSPEEVTKALISVGYPVQAVAEALKALGVSGDIAAGLLAIANVPADVVSGVLKAVFNIVTPPQFNLTLPPFSLTPPPFSLTPPPFSLTPPPFSLTPPPFNLKL